VAYTVVVPETDRILHVRLFPTRLAAVTKKFLAELRKEHDVNDAVFLVNEGSWLHAALHRYNLQFQHVTHGNPEYCRTYLS